LATPATGNDLETYRQRRWRIVPAVDTGGSKSDVLGGARDVKLGRNERVTMTTINEGHRRVAYCECGAQLAGGSQQELFDAAQRHLAHHHPQLLGALGLEMVQHMAEDVGG
jgi:hypothetical protein